MANKFLAFVCLLSIAVYQEMHAMEATKADERTFLLKFYGMKAWADLPEDVQGEIAQCKPAFSTIDVDKPEQRFDASGHFTRLIFSNDSRKLAAGDNSSIYIFDVESAKLEKTCANIFGNGMWDCFALSPDNQSLAVSYEGRLYIDGVRNKNFDKAIRCIDYRDDGKIFMTLDGDFGSVYIYDPKTRVSEELSTGLLLEFAYIEFGELCRQFPNENLKKVTDKLCRIDWQPQVSIKYNTVIVGNKNQIMIITFRGTPYYLGDDRRVKLKTDRSLGFAAFSADDTALVLCDGLVSNSKSDSSSKCTELYSLKNHIPLMTIHNSGGFGALSPDKKWLAALEYNYTRNNLPPVHEDYFEGWKCKAIKLYKVDHLLNQDMDAFIAGVLTLKQLLFIRFLNDLKESGLAPISLISVKDGEGFTLDDIKKEFRKVFASFKPSVKQYLRTQYKF